MRKTVDTNVLVRALVDEDSEQSRIAAKVLTLEAVHVPVTVILETEWVLRSSYKFGRQRVCELLGSVMGLENVDMDQREMVGAAIAAHGAGFDFADAMHVNSAGNSVAFLTFDRALLKVAAQSGSPVSVQVPQTNLSHS